MTKKTKLNIPSYAVAVVDDKSNERAHFSNLDYESIADTANRLLTGALDADRFSKPISSPEDIVAYKKYLTTEIFKSNLDFVKDIYGWRPGQTYLIISPKGWGKSTLNCTILEDMVKNGHKPCVYLSEDFQKDYEVNLADIAKKYPESIRFMSEKDIPLLQKNIPKKEKLHVIAAQIMATIVACDCNVFLFDNITTTRSYDEIDSDLISDFNVLFATIAYQQKIPVIYFAHTKSDGVKIPFTANDIRGIKTGANQTPNVLALYSRTIQIGEGVIHRRTALHWTSIRGESRGANDKKYGCFMDPETKRLTAFFEYEYVAFLNHFVNKIEFKSKDIDLTDHFEIFKNKKKEEIW